MLDGYLEFFMKPALAETYLSLKRELDELVHQKVISFFIPVPFTPDFLILHVLRDAVVLFSI